MNSKAAEILGELRARASELAAVCERVEPEIQEPQRHPNISSNCPRHMDKIATNEIQFLRAAADLQGAFQHRSTLMESNFREIVKAQHADYLGARDRTTSTSRSSSGSTSRRFAAEYGRLIHESCASSASVSPLLRSLLPSTPRRQPLRLTMRPRIPPQPRGPSISTTLASLFVSADRKRRFVRPKTLPVLRKLPQRTRYRLRPRRVSAVDARDGRSRQRNRSRRRVRRDVPGQRA